MRIVLRFAFAAIVAAPMCLATASAASISGVYNTGESEAETNQSGTLDVRFGPCNSNPALTCGVVEAAHPGPDNNNDSDKMPNGEPIIGFTMVTGLVDKGDGKFRKGKINAVDESLDKNKMVWYGVKIDDTGNDQLVVKGCLGFICPRTLTWKKVSD